MEKHLEELRALRAAAVEAVATLKAERQAIADGAKAEERAALSADETAEFRAKSASIKAELDKVEDLDEQIRELESEIERSGKLEAETKTVRKATVEVNEALTYEKGNGQSYFRDLAMQTVGMADEPAKERLRRHMVDVESDKEIRKIAKVGEEYRDLDRNGGTGGYAVPPLWMMNRFIELARAGRTYANLCPTEPLPGGTSSINIPKILTGTSTAIQAADNAALTAPSAHEVDLTDGFVQANVKTIAGQQGIAIQLLDQAAVSVDEFVFRDLAADYANKLNVQVISGTGSNNQVVGVRATAGITQVTATSAGSALEKHQIIYQKIADAIQRVHTSRFLEPEVIVMHPRRWASFHAIFAGDDRPLIVPSGPGFNNLGVLTEVASQRVVGQMHGLPVVTDPTLPTTLGTGTDQDVIHVLRASDLALFESSVRMRALQETRAENLSVLLQVYGYLAFTAARFPQSVVEIGGTALTAPTFA
ncbi:major head protein [Mycobacterium phage Omega]|uniref:Phage capsid-like C-terminal domain-containing protein n=1 Tax=Mycobacterium phage Omega TaxID=2907835 RepID=Q854P9_BPMOM|nr:major head protein [Mycobacterium phage Omega]AAN12659.1 hypothetical protein PBI_OMEGA_15 [Mycobacterium phage Omega]